MKLNNKNIIFGAIALFAINVCADVVVVDGLKYSTNKYVYSATIIGVEGSNDRIEIPERIQPKKTSYTVRAIGFSAFYNSEITSLSIPSTIKEIGGEAFHGCTNMKELYFDAPDCPVWSNEVYSGDPSVLLWKSPIADLVNLEKLTFGPSVQTIRDHFLEPYWTIRTDGSQEATYGPPLRRLKKIIFEEPSSLTKIEKLAFGDCPKVDSIILPATLKAVGHHAFSGCTSLKTIVCKAVIPPTTWERIMPVNPDCILYVPDESVEAYQATYWGDVTVMPMSAAVDRIDDYDSGRLTEPDSYPVYGIDGRFCGRVAKIPEVYDFPEGIYIVNGRKIAVRH